MQIIRLSTDSCGKIKIVEILNVTTTNDEIENSNNDSMAKTKTWDVRRQAVLKQLNACINIKGELKSKTVFSEMALKITLSSILTAEIFNHF